MIEDVIIKKLEKYSDERGWLVEIYRADELNFAPAMAYISQTKPGVARGPHEHKGQSDAFVFVGPGTFRLFLWDNRQGSKTYGERLEEDFGQDNPALVIIPPGVVHGYKCVSDIFGQVINLPDRLYRGQNKQDDVDEIRWEKDPNSPFKID
ncbi:MAG: dTDP-4-dehydrorhamnose 3,5-epimerase family protein [Patescibacteria group bacterium]